MPNIFSRASQGINLKKRANRFRLAILYPPILYPLTSTPKRFEDVQDPDLSDGDTEFQAIINHAKKILKHKIVSGRIHYSKMITGYSGLGIGAVLMVAGVA